MKMDTELGRVPAQDLPVWKYLDRLYSAHLGNHDGALASYIPELAAVAPDRFGIAFVTTDGFIYEVGEVAELFTIQSISKAITYGLALEDHGSDEVLRRIGVEPSGEAFNSITFDERNNRPFNPMVNAGAIAASALVRGSDLHERYARIIDMYRKFTGRVLQLDDAVYRSESLTGNRNRAIAYLELNFGMIGGNVEEHLDLYFRQCSLLVNTRDLAVIGATLANGGINPLTGERALKADYVRSVLSVMNSCGMYDYAGGWQFNIGLPAKSGVGGGITAVLPGQLGIGVFSPRLDAVGNSVRGVKVCEDASRYFGLHLFEDRGGGLVPFRRTYRGGEVRSKRIRRHEDSVRLDQLGRLIAVYELQGEFSFIEAERVTRRIFEDQATASHVIVDLTRVTRLDKIALELLNTARKSIEAAGKSFAIIAYSGEVAAAFEQRIHFDNIDFALEYFEDLLLGDADATDTPVPLEAFGSLASMSPAAIEALEAHLVPRRFPMQQRLIVLNSKAMELFFLTSGRVDVVVPIREGHTYRVSSIDAGNMFGELALFGGARTANVVATAPGEVLVLDEAGANALKANHPAAYAELLLAVGQSLSERLRRANAEIRTLSK